MSASGSPCGTPRTLTLSLPTELTPQQADAILELLEQLHDRLLRHYHAPLLEYWREERVTRQDVPLTDPPF